MGYGYRGRLIDIYNLGPPLVDNITHVQRFNPCKTITTFVVMSAYAVCYFYVRAWLLASDLWTFGKSNTLLSFHPSPLLYIFVKIIRSTLPAVTLFYLQFRKTDRLIDLQI